MSFPTTRLRRSPRLLARTVFREERNERPRKRARPDPSRRLRRKQSRRTLSQPAKSSLLSLPDEPLLLILFHMGASETSGTFRGPRHAFALAQTSTRLMRLFLSLLTRITPDISNPMPPTLSPKHFIAVTRLAGQNLRRLDLPQGCSEVLATLQDACPRLEALSFVDEPDASDDTFVGLTRLDLQSLTIQNPSRKSIRALAPNVCALKLTRVSPEHCKELAAVLRDPPKALHLEMRPPNRCEQSVDVLLDSLCAACPKMEAVFISMDPDYDEGAERDWELFAEQALELIATARRNANVSLCKSMKLRGQPVFRLLSQAHPRAVIELSNEGCTFGDDGDGLHVLRLAICQQKPTFDMSRLRKVFIPVIGRDCGTIGSWKEALKHVEVGVARVDSLHMAKRLRLNTRTVEIPFWRLYSSTNARHHYSARHRYRSMYWNWLSRVHEVRLIRAGYMIPRGGVTVFLRILSFVLDECQGKVLWIEPIRNLHAKYQKKRIHKLRPAFRAARAALKRFEDRGGDAGTVRALLSTMRWTGSPDSQ